MVSGQSLNHLVAELSTPNHTWLSDVPHELGGNDSAPDPHRILESALAACTIITVQMYAQRKGIPLVGITADVNIDQEGAESALSRKIGFVGNLSNEQKEDLMRVANKCPIHKIITSHVTINTEMKA